MKRIVIFFCFAFLATLCLCTALWADDHETVLIDFNEKDKWGDWWVVNDRVMGGVSQSDMVYGGDGTALFMGRVSLANNGGFASVRARPNAKRLAKDYKGLLIRVRGDGKAYQLRLRTNNRFDGVSYRFGFQTQPNQWTVFRAPFREFDPVFRGRILRNVSPVLPQNLEQVGVMISDKQVGDFQLEIEWIKAYK